MAPTQALPRRSHSTQIPTPHCPLGQTVPQAPQLFGSFCRSTQVPPQSVRPVAQAVVVVPPPPLGSHSLKLLQYMPSPQAAPHAPQLLLSLVRSTQVPPQSVSPASHASAGAFVVVAAHAPCWQVCPSPQATSHGPQNIGSVCRSTQRRPHLVSGSQDGSIQTPPSQ